MMSVLFSLTDGQWAAIEPHLPRNQPGAQRVDDRRVISGIIHVLKTGCRWCDCPQSYGPSTKSKSLDNELFSNLQIFYQAFGFVECVRSTTISDVGYELAGIKGGSSVSREQQKTWVAALLSQYIKAGKLRKQAEAIVAADIVDLLSKDKIPAGFTRSWFEVILDEERNLKLTYRQKKLSNKDVEALDLHYREFANRSDYPKLPNHQS